MHRSGLVRAAIAGSVAAMLAGCIPQVERDMNAAPPPALRQAPSPPPPPYDDPPSAGPSTDLERYRPADQEREAGDKPRLSASVLPLSPAARPVWESRPATADGRTVAASTYVARPGDTLPRIANRTGAAGGAIAQANGLTPPYSVEPGRRLTIPGGRYHVIHPGEAGIAIARAYGVAWSRIVAANDLTEPFVLRVGQRILIPDTLTNSSFADRAAAFTLNVDDILTGGEPAPARDHVASRSTTRPARVLPAGGSVAAPARLHGGFLWPVSGRVTNRFGPGTLGQRNDGIEIAAPLGTPVRATADGVVAYVGDGIAALGGIVIVKHGDGWTSVYGHASRLFVQRGQTVRQGQTIALSGDTGNIDRPKVHFELRKGRTPVDPQDQLPRTRPGFGATADIG